MATSDDSEGGSSEGGSELLMVADNCEATAAMAAAAINHKRMNNHCNIVAALAGQMSPNCSINFRHPHNVVPSRKPSLPQSIFGTPIMLFRRGCRAWRPRRFYFRACSFLLRECAFTFAQCGGLAHKCGKAKMRCKRCVCVCFIWMRVHW